MVLVGEPERGLSPVNRLASFGALEDRFFHARAADGGRPLLAQHPAQAIGDVRLAAAVGTDDGRDPVVEADLGRISERLEAVELDADKLHCNTNPTLSTSSTSNPARAICSSSGRASSGLS